MENEEMLEQEMVEQTTETENVDTQTTEENGEGIELTDTSETTETDDVGNSTSNDETVEEETEEVKTFTQEEVDAIVQKRLARKERDFQKELSKYRDTDNVLRTTLNLKDGEDTNTKLREYYEAEGVKLPEKIKVGLTDNEIRILAKAEANDIIESGDAEVEANKLASKGYDNMNFREKEIFNTLAEHLTHERQTDELKSIGVKTDLLDSKEFKDFASKFNSNTSIKDIYELYSKSHKEEKKIEKMGSVKSDSNNNGIKSFYTYEEAQKFTRDDLDKNPKLYEAITNSMAKW